MGLGKAFPLPSSRLLAWDGRAPGRITAHARLCGLPPFGAVGSFVSSALTNVPHLDPGRWGAPPSGNLAALPTPRGDVPETKQTEVRVQHVWTPLRGVASPRADREQVPRLPLVQAQALLTCSHVLQANPPSPCDPRAGSWGEVTCPSVLLGAGQGQASPSHRAALGPHPSDQGPLLPHTKSRCVPHSRLTAWWR